MLILTNFNVPYFFKMQYFGPDVCCNSPSPQVLSYLSTSAIGNAIAKPLAPPGYFD